MLDDKTESRNGRLHGQDMLGWDWGTGYMGPGNRICMWAWDMLTQDMLALGYISTVYVGTRYAWDMLAQDMLGWDTYVGMEYVGTRYTQDMLAWDVLAQNRWAQDMHGIY